METNYPIEDRLEFLISVTSEFSKKYTISVKQAFNYIKRFNGIKFLQEFYDIEHTQSYPDIVEDVKNICINNGGMIGK